MFRPNHFGCLLIALGLTTAAFSQEAVVRGQVFDAQTGAPVPFASVLLLPTERGTITDETGFFSFSEVTPDTLTLQVSYLGYATLDTLLPVEAGRIYFRRLLLQPEVRELATVDVSAERERRRTTVNVSAQRLEAEQISTLPAVGGEPDLAQYLTVLPGVVSSGDQGGQLFIRGGTPVQNKVLLDGLTIYNPFHTIGLFSVFETEAIQSAEVQTGGFQADEGGRLSAILDIQTRTGNRREWHGLASASPFQAKAMIEGPIRRLRDDPTAGSVSMLVTGKYSYLDQTSPLLYPYAAEDDRFGANTAGEERGLPFQYGDLYGKISFSGQTGSQFDVFGLHFTDQFVVPELADLSWRVSGAGANFRLLPPNSQAVIDGVVGYTDYLTELTEPDAGPRRSGVVSYTAQLHFSYFGQNAELRYGLDLTGFNTDFQFQNPVGVSVAQENFTTEIAGYLRYRYRGERLILEPGLRLHYYAAQSQISPEPRLGIKYLISDQWRIKAAAGLYSQNVVGTTNEDDVVNFFVGFLAGPEEQLTDTEGNPTDNNIQQAWHAIGGLEYTWSPSWRLNVEGYYKGFSQLLTLNRNKLSGADPNFMVEKGAAYGLETTLEYQSRHWSLWLAYAWSRTERDDGEQVYPTVYDRRHNINVLGTYRWGDRLLWGSSLRWNFGSAFPFTQTSGFFQDIPPGALLDGDGVLTGNFPIGTLLSGDRNGGRLIPYHRLDLSLKRIFPLGNTDSRLEAVLSISNAYNRDNIFYVDRLTGQQINQLPILPALTLTWRW